MASPKKSRRLAWLILALLPLLTLPAWSQQEPSSAPKPDDTPATTTTLDRARDAVELLEARIAVKRAKLHELEVRLAQARRKLKTAEANHQFEMERARDRVEWAEKMFNAKYLSESQLRAERHALKRLEAAEQRRDEPNKEK